MSALILVVVGVAAGFAAAASAKTARPITKGEILAPPVLLSGDVLDLFVSRLEVRFLEATRAVIPISWVGQPVDAAFFVYEVPREHWAPAARPAVIEAKDGDGRVAARLSLPPPTFGPGAGKP